MDIGKRIRSRRMEMNMTQDELAEKLLVSRPAVSNWETGKNYPDLQIIVMLSEVLDVSLDDLLKGDANVVEQITKDTRESGKLRKRTKILIAALAVLLVIVLAYIGIFVIWCADISEPDQVKSMELKDNLVEIKLDIPSYYSNRSWYEDITPPGEGEAYVNIYINYGFGKAKEGMDYLAIPIYTNDPDDLLSKDSIKRNDIKGIRIMSSNGEKVVRQIEFK